MLTSIFIDQLQVQAPIGWYEEERTTKVSLNVSIKVQFESMDLNDEINRTIDYGRLTAIVTEQSKIEMKLLETLGENIIEQIELETFQNLRSILVTIRKSHIQAKGVLAEAHGVELLQTYPKNKSNSVSL